MLFAESNMLRHSIIAALALAAGFTATPAAACARHAPLALGAIRSADLVVTGRIVDRRADARGEVRFDMVVDEVLRGRAGRRVPIGFDGRSSGPPRTLAGRRVLIALNNPGPGSRGAFTVLHAMCSDPFVLDARSPQAAEARRMLGRR